MWNLDGVVITDMSATGASPTYFDFDAFEEITVTTGGNDLRVPTGGIGINLVTKRGTNEFHGGARCIPRPTTTSSSGNRARRARRTTRALRRARDKADHIEQIKDYGFDLGGPIVKDKLWFYGTYGKQDIRLTALEPDPGQDAAPLLQRQAQLAGHAEHMVSAFYFLGNKQKFGRCVGLRRRRRPTASSGTRTTPTPTAGCRRPLEAAGRPHLLAQLLPVGEGAPTTTPASASSPRGGPDQTYTLDYVASEAIGSYHDYLASGRRRP